MIGFYLRRVLWPVLLFTVLLMMIRIRPYDDHEARQLLLPDGCPAPCFIGIQPGISTAKDALKQLEASTWITNIDDLTRGSQGYIRWDWSDQKPEWISDDTKGKLWIVENLVDTITIYSDFVLGETQLALGLPEGELVDPTQNRSGTSSLYTAFYNQKGLQLKIWQPCNVVEPYLRPVIVMFSPKSKAYAYPYRNWLKDVFRVCLNRSPNQ